MTDTWTTTAKVPLPLLGVPHEVVAPLLARVHASPLAPLFGRHMAEVRRVADDVTPTSALALGTATVALARAVVTSVSDIEDLQRGALDDILLLRVKSYVRDHLGDPRLDPAAIAAAHHVSVRQLYRACAQSELHLEQWIIEQRLERAHEDLARKSIIPISVSAVSQRWGFASPSHFARRFREAYGMSPREWRALH